MVVPVEVVELIIQPMILKLPVEAVVEPEELVV